LRQEEFLLFFIFFYSCKIVMLYAGYNRFRPVKSRGREFMIEHLRGVLISKKPDHAVVDISGIGFGVEISLTTYDALPAAGDICDLYSYLYVREDTFLLFGFATMDELEIFKILINTSGIGPKLNLHILSGMPIGEFAAAIASNDIRKLTTMPGIGKKTAERLCVELKEKLNPFLNNADGGKKTFSKSGGGPLEDAVAALIALGVKPPQAERAVLAAAHELGQDAAVEDLIRVGLKHRK